MRSSPPVCPDVELVVAGPSNISGTAALVSAMKAYEIVTGEKLSEDSVDAANNELVVTGEVGDELGDASKAAELIAAVKNEVLANGDKDLTDDEIGAAIDRICKEMGITLDPSTRQQIIDLIKKIGSTDFDVDALKEQAKGLFDKVEGVLNEISGTAIRRASLRASGIRSSPSSRVCSIKFIPQSAGRSKAEMCDKATKILFQMR